MQGEHGRPLPLAGAPHPERADAARNRTKILAAAAKIIDEKGMVDLSLDEVAKVAGVGVGTVYRRFGDRSALIWALLDETEREFQAAFISGPPPLGPGAPPRERIRAFLHAMVDRFERHHEMLRLADSGPRWGGAGPYGINRAHLIGLLRQDRPNSDAGYLADALLGTMAPALLHHQRFILGYSAEALKSGIDDLTDWC
jgi:AcrR family transcriptional regulator